MQTGELQYKPGVIMTNLLLADEINRTSSKTQAALLEAMEEKQVTVDGVTRKLEEPFIVLATQNPVGTAGTQKLPKAQLDRFRPCSSAQTPRIYSAGLKSESGACSMPERESMCIYQRTGLCDTGRCAGNLCTGMCAQTVAFRQSQTA